MKTIEQTLRSYLTRCQMIFENHRNGIPKRIFSDILKPAADIRSYFQNAVRDSENSAEFADFVQILESNVLSKDLDRLVKREEKRRRKSEKGILHTEKRATSSSIREWRLSLARHAAQRFFMNTGAYSSIWDKLDWNESELVASLFSEGCTSSSECLRLLVFDGFELYDHERRLKCVSLPVGELRVFGEKELQELLGLPQSAWYDGVNTELPRRMTPWHILVVREPESYRGQVGSLASLMNIMESKWEDDTEIVTPVFLCLGEDANLAEEIRVRTNVFDTTPVTESPLNGYLPWDDFDPEGNECPKRTIKRIGVEGNVLHKVFELWHAVNALSSKGLLRYPSQTYVRSLMNWHSASDNSIMYTYVGLVSTIETLLTPDGRGELAYKTAIRAAALLASDPKRRSEYFHLVGEWYKTRSKIVHAGHSKEDLWETVRHPLLKITRQIFLRYIALVYLFIYKKLSNSLLPDSSSVDSGKKHEVISKILDTVIIDPDLTRRIEDSLEKWGMNKI